MNVSYMQRAASSAIRSLDIVLMWAGCMCEKFNVRKLVLQKHVLHFVVQKPNYMKRRLALDTGCSRARVRMQSLAELATSAEPFNVFAYFKFKCRKLIQLLFLFVSRSVLSFMVWSPFGRHQSTRWELCPWEDCAKPLWRQMKFHMHERSTPDILNYTESNVPVGCERI